MLNGGDLSGVYFMKFSISENLHQSLCPS